MEAYEHDLTPFFGNTKVILHFFPFFGHMNFSCYFYSAIMYELLMHFKTKKNMANVLLIIKTSFYLNICHFGCGYKRDVLQNGTR